MTAVGLAPAALVKLTEHFTKYLPVYRRFIAALSPFYRGFIAVFMAVI
ncbi:hypothetical protein IP91_01363 [Pseudoduganella lurida]|uniref:Uncharacterized protein n=2 Tax=Pseudoduganella lurida TaxID=1036180 RepID=A0A562RFQ1_9BURK|nr:hypothetical protein IP91_01363 [Pseudoduganella lurida]